MNNNPFNQVNGQYLLNNPYIKKEIDKISKRIKSTKILDNLIKLKDNISNDQIKNKNNILKENNFSLNRCIFSNIEIKKHIKDNKNDNIDGDNNLNLSDKMINLKYMNNSYYSKNRNYKNNNSLNIYKNIISKNSSYSPYKNRNESKDDSLIKHSNNLLFQEIKEDKLYVTTPKICSKGSFRINKNFFNPDNKKLKLLKINDEINIETKKTQNSNTNKPNNFIFPKTKVINDILIDNNTIRTNYLENKKKSNLYLDVYYHIIKSIIQKKGNFFGNKKINYLPFQLYKFTHTRNNLYDKDEIKINNYYNNINNNNFSLRELYRTMNNDNYFFYSPFKKNKNKKIKTKKKEKKSFKLKIIKNDIEKSQENSKKKTFNLKNLQYDFYKSNQDKKFEFDKTILRRKNIYLNKYINLKNKDDDYLQFFKTEKIISNLYDSIFRKKNNIKNKKDILENGLTNSSSQIKINNKNGLNKYIENKNLRNKIQISKTPFRNGNKILKLENN